MPCGKVRWERPHDARPLEISRQEDERNNNQRGIRVGYTPSVHRTVAHPATTLPSRTGLAPINKVGAGEALKSTAEAGVKDSGQHPESGDAHPRQNTQRARGCKRLTNGDRRPTTQSRGADNSRTAGRAPEEQRSQMQQCSNTRTVFEHKHPTKVACACAMNPPRACPAANGRWQKQTERTVKPGQSTS